MATPIGESSRKAGARALIGLALVFAINAVLIGLFFDKAWIPSDDGHYVHVADRLAAGQVLNRDVEELHPGYVHFLHAASLRLFGDEIVSLRYPLMALLMLQSLVVFAVFHPVGSGVATVAAVTMSAIGTLQIASPTTSLYALGVTVALIAVLARTTPRSRYRAVTIGVLLGLVFLFRQLTAVFVVMGVLAYVFTEERVDRDTSSGGFGVVRFVVGLMLAGLIGYLIRSTDFSAALLFGLCPLWILGWAFRYPTMTNRAAVRFLSLAGLGAVMSALPIVGYHLVYGSLGAWINDVFLRSVSVTGLEHIREGRYLYTVVFSLITPAIRLSLASVPNALYWIALVFVAFIAGAQLVLRVRRLPQRSGVGPSMALPFVAVFYALVSVFNQIHYYLYLSAGLSIVAILWMTAVEGGGPDDDVGMSGTLWKACAGALALSAIAIAFHAGQPYTRTFAESIAGERAGLVESALPRMGLWIDPNEERQLGELLRVIGRETADDDFIFVVPNNAELYFLSRRANPFRLFNPTISLMGEEEAAAFLEEFARVRPALVVHDTLSQYNTSATADLVGEITEGFERVATVDHYVVFARR